MKHNIIIHKDLCIEFAEGTLFNQHSVGTKSLVAKLEGWMLEEGACLFIAFKNGTDEVPPTLMAFEPKEGIYYMDIPRAVICKNGNWQMCVYKKLDWDEETKTASAVEVGRAKPLYITATVCDEEGHCVTEYDVASAVNTILNCSELAGELNGQAQEARDGAVLARESAENAQVAAETALSGAEAAKVTAENSAEVATEQAEIAANNAVAAANSAADAGAASVIARTAAGQAESHENNTREMLARVIKQASDAAASAQTAEEKARQAAELFATHSIKINAEFAAVEDLPALGDSQTIYFIPNGGTGANSFDEYVWVGSKSGYEKIGSTEVDLTSYATKTEVAETVKTLHSDIDQLYGKTERLETADDLIHARISQVEELAYNGLAEETTARESEDQRLGERIATEETARKDETKQVKERIATEETERKDADKALGNRIDDNYSAIADLQSGKVNKLGDVMTGNLSATILNGTSQVQENGQRVYSPNNTPWEMGNGYIRFNSGLQICWGFFNNGSYVGDKTLSITFGKPFSKDPSLIMTSGKLDGTTSYRSTNSNYYSLTSTGANIGWYGNTANSICWVAIGAWK